MERDRDTSGGALADSSGLLSGTPTATGDFSSTARVTDGAKAGASQALSLSVIQGKAGATIGPPPGTLTIVTSSLPNGTVGQTYGQTMVASGGSGSYVWSIDTGSLPSGLSLSGTGVLSGTPTTSGSFTFTLKVTDPDKNTATLAFGLVINSASSALTISTSSLPSGTINRSYSQSFTAVGGATPYKWSSGAGSLPRGLTLSGDGLLSGTPAQAGLFTFSVTVTDGIRNAAASTFNLTINGDATPVTIVTAALPPAIVDQPYKQQLEASGGVTPYTWSFSLGVMRPGLSLSASGPLIGNTEGDRPPFLCYLRAGR